jgi:hypothetical protein
MDDGFVLPLKWSWRSQAKRCIQCGWLFSCAAWHEDRKRCLACTSKLGVLRLNPEQNTARMQPAGEGEDP